MQYKVFRIPVASSIPHEETLNGFLRSRRIVSVRHELVQDGANSAFCFLVEFVADNKEPEAGRGKIDYREVLSAVDFALFSRLRELRKVLAESNGLPVYAVYTNEQLAEIAKRKPESLAALGAIPGIGQGKLEKFGTAVLEALRGSEGAGATRT